MIRKMNKLIILFCLVLAGANTLFAQAPEQAEIKIKKDVAFGKTLNNRGENETLLLDIYAPTSGISKNRPVIMWMHGGGFRLKNDKSQKYIVAMSERFAKRGYVCVSINYRVRENPKEDKLGTMSDALADAMKGLNWMRKNSDDLGIDKSNIVIGGGSAGGMLGTHFCYRESDDQSGWDKSGIVAFVNLWGSPDSTWGEFVIDKNDPPTVIVHGTEDALVPYENSKKIIADLEKNGVKNKLITIEGAGHTPARHMDNFEIEIAAFLSELIN